MWLILCFITLVPLYFIIVFNLCLLLFRVRVAAVLCFVLFCKALWVTLVFERCYFNKGAISIKLKLKLSSTYPLIQDWAMWAEIPRPTVADAKSGQPRDIICPARPRVPGWYPNHPNWILKVKRISGSTLMFLPDGALYSKVLLFTGYFLFFWTVWHLGSPPVHMSSTQYI